MNANTHQDVERYLRFSLGKEEYAIPLLKVREVIAMPETTPIPQTPNYFLGIMNLRGQVITVMDLRTKLGIKAEMGAETSVIIADLGDISVGVVVDSINAVLNPDPKDLAEKPELSSGVKSSEYITGVYKKESGLVLLLNIAKLLNFEDKQILTNAGKKAA
jgi:purine-binding chemotaxis protein CheW